MPDNASVTGEPGELTERVRFALESGDLDAIRDLLDPGARWGAASSSVLRYASQPTGAIAHRRVRRGTGMATGAQIAAFGVALSGDCGSRVADQIGRLRAQEPGSATITDRSDF